MNDDQDIDENESTPIDNETEKADRECDIEREDNPMGGVKLLTLDEIAIKHNADKSSRHHDYCRVYAKYFDPIRFSAKKVLEIGIDGGNSMRTWAEYFPCARIFGIDHNAQFIENAKRDLDTRRIEPFWGEATQPEVFEDVVARLFGSRLDVIIDDGGHFSHQIIPAFNYGWPLLKSGGLYCIEDIHHIYKHEKLNEPGKLFDFLLAKIHALNEHGLNQCGKPSNGVALAFIQALAFIHFTKSLCIIGKA